MHTLTAAMCAEQQRLSCCLRYTQHCLLQRRYKDLQNAWKRQQHEFLSDSDALLHESTKLTAASAESVLSNLAWQAANEQLHHKLQKLRSIKQIQDQVRGRVEPLDLR